VAQGHCEVRPSIAAPASNSGSRPAPNFDSGPALTSLLLSNSIVHPEGTADPADPLRGENFQIDLPATTRFASSDKLTLYYGILLPDVAEQSRRFEVAYSIKSSAGASSPLSAEELTIPLPQNRLLVLKQFDLNRLAPGRYTMEVKIADASGHGTASTSAGFSVQ